VSPHTVKKQQQQQQKKHANPSELLADMRTKILHIVFLDKIRALATSKSLELQTQTFQVLTMLWSTDMCVCVSLPSARATEQFVSGADRE